MSNFISPDAQAQHAKAVADVAAVNTKRSLINSVIFILNFPILVAVLIGLAKIGFVTILVPTSGIGNLLAVTAMIAAVFMLIRKLSGYAYGVFLIFTCCTGLIFLPIYSALVGYASLWIVSLILPSYFQMTANVLYGIIAGLVIGIVQIPEVAKQAEPEALKSEAQQAKELAEKNK